MNREAKIEKILRKRTENLFIYDFSHVISIFSTFVLKNQRYKQIKKNKYVSSKYGNANESRTYDHWF